MVQNTRQLFLWLLFSIAVLGMTMLDLPWDIPKWLNDIGWYISFLMFMIAVIGLTQPMWEKHWRTLWYKPKASALIAVMQTDFLADTQYVMFRGLPTLLLPVIVLKTVFDIEVPTVMAASSAAVLGLWLYVRRLGMTGRHQEQKEVIGILRWFGGLFAMMLVIGVLVVISLELLAAFKAALHQQFGTFRQ